jgi:DNA-binding IclR family transcriptional regulator
MEERKNKTNYIIQAVSHALDLLEQFRDDVDELGVTELSRRLKLHKNNVFRLLATLESRNYIQQNPLTGNYRLGLKNLELGQTMIRQMGLLRQARPILEQLSAMNNETVYIAALKETYVVYMDVVESRHAVRVVPRLGAWLPAHCTAAGKVQLASLLESGAELPLPDPLPSCTGSTISDRDELIRQLRIVAEQGYAIDDEEKDADVRCVSAPIRDYTTKVVGAVSISGPVARLCDKRLNSELIPQVKNAAAEISQRLGYPPSRGYRKTA